VKGQGERSEILSNKDSKKDKNSFRRNVIMMKKKGVILLVISMMCFADETPIKVTKEYIQALKKQGFDQFIANKKKQYQLMNQVTSIPVVGSIVTWGMETIGNVNMKEAKVFLERVFSQEQAFNDAVNALEAHEQNLTYLHGVFKNISDTTLQKRSKEELVTAMRSIRHEEVPIPRKMGEKNEQGEYIIPDSKFLPFAACSLFALHTFEQETSRKSRMQLKRKKLTQTTYKKGSYEQKVAFAPLAQRHTSWRYGNAGTRISYT
jgi:hypothetical protein